MSQSLQEMSKLCPPNEPDELELGLTQKDALVPLDVSKGRVPKAAVNVEALTDVDPGDRTTLSPSLPSRLLTSVDIAESINAMKPSINDTSLPNDRTRPPSNRSPSPVFHIAQHQDNARKRKESTSNDQIPLKSPKRQKRACNQVSRPGTVIGNDEVPQHRPKKKKQAAEPNAVAEKRRQGSSVQTAADPNEDELAIKEETEKLHSFKEQIEKLHPVFDEKFRDGTSKHKTAAQMYYDSRQRHFLVKTFEFDKKKYLSDRKVTNV